MIVDEEKPVASPRNVAGNWSIARHVDRNLCSSSITRNIGYFDASFVIEMRDDDADRRFDAMDARTNTIQVGEGSDDTDSPVTAHSQVSHAVEKDDSGHTRVINGRAQQRTHDRIGTAWLVHDRTAKAVMFVSEALDSSRKRPITEVWRAVYDHARRLTTSV